MSVKRTPLSLRTPQPRVIRGTLYRSSSSLCYEHIMFQFFCCKHLPACLFFTSLPHRTAGTCHTVDTVCCAVLLTGKLRQGSEAPLLEPRSGVTISGIDTSKTMRKRTIDCLYRSMLRDILLRSARGGAFSQCLAARRPRARSLRAPS